MTPEERLTAMCRGLFAEPGLMKALDELAAEFMDGVLDDFLGRWASTIAKHAGDGEDADIALAAVVGWVLGYPGAKATPERREDIVVRQIMVASYSAGVCADVLSTTARRHLV